MKQSAKNALKKIPGFAPAYRAIRDWWQVARGPRRTPFGFMFVGDKRMQTGWFEPAEAAIFNSLINRADVFVNAGANMGFYCALALHEGKHTIAFEPLPRNAAVLRKNIAENHWQDRAEVFQMALADRAGEAPLYGRNTGASLIEGWAGAAGRRTATVKVSSLDIMLGDRLRPGGSGAAAAHDAPSLAGKNLLVLVDVEGFEYELLQGAEALLGASPKPVWLVEINLLAHQPAGRPENPHFAETFELFFRHGYVAYASADGRVRELGKDEIEESARERREIRTDANFIFVHPSSTEARHALMASGNH